MTRDDIEKKVKECIERVAREQALELAPLEGRHRIVDDLGFSSLDVATLTAFLESIFHVDPFATNMAVITEIVTMKDVCDVYDRCINNTAANESSDGKNGAESERMRKRISKRTAG
jgi:acyl carrier protein